MTIQNVLYLFLKWNSCWEIIRALSHFQMIKRTLLGSIMSTFSYEVSHLHGFFNHLTSTWGRSY